MLRDREPAHAAWEVERQSAGTTLRPFCVVILRNKKKAGKSIVKASSSDFGTMYEYAKELTEDLYTLSNEEFIKKHNLGQGV